MGGEVQTNVSDLVGHVIVEIVDKSGKQVSLLLENFGFDDWSAVQSKFLRDKRSRMIQSAVDAGKALVDMETAGTDARRKAEAEAQAIKDRAITMAGNLVGLTEAEVAQLMSSVEGSATFLWTMIERRYPGKYTIDDVVGFIRWNAKAESIVLSVVESLKTAMGIGVASGN